MNNRLHIDRQLRRKAFFSPAANCLLLGAFFVFSFSASAGTLVPPYSGATSIHFTSPYVWLIGGAGSQFDPSGSATPANGTFCHGGGAFSGVIGGAGLFVADEIRGTFSVPTTGEYDINISGTILKIGHLSTSVKYLAGANASEYTVDLIGKIYDASGFAVASTYDNIADERFNPVKAIASEVASSLFSSFVSSIDSRNIKTVLELSQTIYDTYDNLGIDLLAANTPITLTMRVPLVSGVTYKWGFGAQSTVIASSISLGGQVSYLNSRMRADSVSVTYVGTGSFVPPSIESLSQSPSPVFNGSQVELVATQPRAFGGTIQEIKFYRDSNLNNVYDSGTDQELGAGTQSGSDWRLSRTANYGTGRQRYFARARDSNNLWSAPISCIGYVEPAPAVSGNYISIDSLDWQPTASGDKDGVTETGENVELLIRLRSTANVNSFFATLSSSLGNLTIYDNEEQYPPISAGNASLPYGDGYNMYLDASSNVTVPFALYVEYTKDGQDYYQTFTFSKAFYQQGTRVAVLQTPSYVVDDSPSRSHNNNGDGIIQAGESVSIRPLMANNGLASATGIRMWLAYSGNDFTVDGASNERSYPVLNACESAYPSSSGGYYIRDIQRSSSGTAYLDVHINDDQVTNELVATQGLALTIEAVPWLRAKWTTGENDKNIGVVAPASFITNTITIANEGAAPLVISNIAPSHADISLCNQVFPVTVSAGNSLVVTSVFNTATLNASITRQIVVTSNGRIVTDAGLTNVTTLLMHGTVTSQKTGEVSLLASLPNDYMLSTCVGDCNGDGTNEVVVLTRGRSGTTATTPTLYVYRMSGDNLFTLLWQSDNLFSNMSARTTCSPLAVADVNKDGKADIIVAMYSTAGDGSANGKLFFLEQTSSNVWSVTWSGYTAQGKLLDVTVGDLDKDGRNEILLTTAVRSGTASLRRGYLYVIENAGGTSFSQTYSIGDLPTDSGNYIQAFSGVTVADTDNDGMNEIIFGAGHPEISSSGAAGNTAPQLYIYESTGDNTYTRRYAGLSYAGENWDPWLYCKIAAADFDGDGRQELALTSDSDYNLWVWEMSGQNSWSNDIKSTKYEVTYAVPTTPTVLTAADGDSDQHPELLLGTSWNAQPNVIIFDAFGTNSYIKCWETNAADNVLNICATNLVPGGSPYVFVSVDYQGLSVYGSKKANDVDLSVSAVNMSVSPSPIEGATSTVSVIVANVMSTGASNVLVRCYDGDPAQGNLEIGSDTVIQYLPGNGATNLSFKWLPRCEGVATLFAQVDPSNTIVEANESNNTANCQFSVDDSDESGPVISPISITEGTNGDGDGMIGDDERARLTWSQYDPSGIAATSLSVDGSNVTVSGTYYADIGPLMSGMHTATVVAIDADTSPATNMQSVVFTVVPREKLAVFYGNQPVTNGTNPVLNLGLLPQNVPAVACFAVRNVGGQRLLLNGVTADGSIGKTDPLTTNITAGGITTFNILPITTATGIFTGTVAVTSSDSASSQIVFDVTYEVRTDTDGDGIPDAWELAYFPGLDAATTNSDSDGDHLLDIDEFIAGTNPRDSNDYFRVKNCVVPPTGNDTAVLVWDTVTGRLYRVQTTTNLLNLWSNVFQHVGNGTTLSYTNDMPTPAARFFKLDVQLQE